MNCRSNDRIVVFAIIAFLVIAFNSRRGERLWHGPSGEPEIMTFQSDDEEMNEALETAQKSIAKFIDALVSPRSSQNHFSIKVGFSDDNGNEYFWLNDVRYLDGKFFGTIANSPETVQSVFYGMPVELSRDEAADWMFVENGRLVGGYTTRVMYDRLSPKERQMYDENAGFAFD
ncbi:MAG: DUF2314 domain-containing protein [Pirellulaceae bacterium]